MAMLVSLGHLDALVGYIFDADALDDATITKLSGQGYQGDDGKYHYKYAGATVSLDGPHFDTNEYTVKINSVDNSKNKVVFDIYHNGELQFSEDEYVTGVNKKGIRVDSIPSNDGYYAVVSSGPYLNYGMVLANEITASPLNALAFGLKGSYAVLGQIKGTDAGDAITGTSTGELIDSARGSDVVHAQGGNDRIFGGTGSDQLFGDAGNDVLNGAAGDDKLYGGAGADKLSAGSGDDVLNGGAGSDRLFGDSGHDTMTGGSGADTFVFADNDASLPYISATKIDVVTDFRHSDGDAIDLSRIDADVQSAGNQGFVFIGTSAFSHEAGEVRYEISNNHTYIQMDTDGSGAYVYEIALNGKVPLQQSDFIF